MIRIFLLFLSILYLGSGNALASADCSTMGCYAIHAEQGDAAAARWLGDFYFTGADIKPDYPKAEHWYLRAGAAGSVAAQIRLGFMYAENHFPGVETDLQKGEYWFKQAAEQGDRRGQFRLGNFYHHYQKPPDYHKAVKWLTKAAEQGGSAAQYDLAQIYQNGSLGAPDAEKSLSYMKQAANNDLRQAQMSLSQHYEQQGDFEKALFWARKIAAGPGKSRYWQDKVTSLENRLTSP